MMNLDETDQKILAALKRDGRKGLAALAADLGISRNTVRARMTRLIETGEIAGFTALTRGDLAESPVRALMMVAIEGAGTDRAVGRMLAMPAVQAVHATSGRWDVIVELATDSLTHLDETLSRIRKLEAVTQSETHLLMSTRRATSVR
ncbi:Lrp/AsnC family transcriptional regulator [Pararhodobacter aggregans]|uniref:Lrp/AsnC family transcriptional regulator n=1 Tax=Pararhodobacter aggregans TaxID=404875 RepID=UPI003A8F49B9